MESRSCVMFLFVAESGGTSVCLTQLTYIILGRIADKFYIDRRRCYNPTSYDGRSPSKVAEGT